MDESFRRFGGVSMSKENRLLTNSLQRACRVLLKMAGVISVRQVREVLLEEHLSLLQGSDVDVAAGTVRVTTLVQHVSGELVSADMRFKPAVLEADGLLSDVGRVMRLQIENLFGVVVGDLQVSDESVASRLAEPSEAVGVASSQVAGTEPESRNTLLAPSDSLVSLAQSLATERGVAIPENALADADQLNLFVTALKQKAKVGHATLPVVESVTPEMDGLNQHPDMAALSDDRRRNLIQFFSGSCAMWDALLSGLKRWKDDGQLTVSLETAIHEALVLFGKRKGVAVLIPTATVGAIGSPAASERTAQQHVHRPEGKAPIPQQPAKAPASMEQSTVQATPSRKSLWPIRGIDPRDSEVFKHEDFGKLPRTRQENLVAYFRSKAEQREGFVDWLDNTLLKGGAITKQYRDVVFAAHRQLVIRHAAVSA